MSDPVFGVVLRKVDEESRPIVGADLSTIGIIGPAAGADPLIFPLDTPVRVYSNNISLTSKLGSQGYLADAIRGINDQMAETQFAARCVVVRTADGVDVDPAIKIQKTINNIVGSSTAGTGIHAFLKSVSVLSVTPRLIIAPGYTGQMANGINEVTQDVDGGGEGYIDGQSYPITFTGGGEHAVQATGHAIGMADGTLGPVTLDTPGAWYEDDLSPAVNVVAPSAGKRVTAAVVGDNSGVNYQVNDTITLANGVIVTVSSILSGGVIDAITIGDRGLIAGTATNPTNPQAQVSTSGQGSGANFTLTWTAYQAATYTGTISVGANPVAVSLTGVLNSLLGHAVVESSGISETDDDNWRETINSDRLIPISGGVRVLDPDTATVLFRPLAPRVVGIAVRRDHEKGAPFHSWANQPVQGIVGPMRDIGFSLTDDANEAQGLLANNIGVLVRGELGNEFAIASGGFIFIGTDNAGEDELWRFYNMKRGRDFIHLSLLRSMRYYLGRYNITTHTVQAILNGMKMLLRDLQADGHILGYRISFNPDSNSPDEIRLGHLVVGFKAEEAAPLRKLTIESGRYREAVDAMIAELATQLSLAA
jgi:phage tail sheath protein FI